MALSVALSQPFRSKVEAVLAQLDAAAATLDQAARDARGGVVSGWWQSTLGIEPSVDAIESKAYAQRNLNATVRARAERLTSDVEAAAFLEDAKRNRWADVGDTPALAASLTFSGGASVIAADSARDAAQLAKVGVPALALVALAFLVFRFGGRR